MADQIGLSVSGGVNGTAAHLADLFLLADHGERAAAELAAIALRCQAVFTHPALLASAPLDPPGVLRFEQALYLALDGPEGLTALAARIGTRSAALRAAGQAYRVVDAVQGVSLQLAGRALGQAVGVSVGASIAAGAAPPWQVPGAVAVYQVAHAVGVGWTDVTTPAGDVLAFVSSVLADHPGVAYRIADASPGFLHGLLDPYVGPFGPELVMCVLARVYPDGRPAVADLGPDADPAMIRAPAGIADLLHGLAHRDAASRRDESGQVDVRVLTHPDGTQAFIVDIPGMRTWRLRPGGNGVLNDLSTSVHSLNGEVTAYERGIAEALHRAGAWPRDPVMLVGHSQGGIVAAQAAAHFTATGEFAVSHVVTAGAPIGAAGVPESVHLLALENTLDLVPQLDAASNSDTPSHLTARFALAAGGNHSLAGCYLPAARALDARGDPSVAAFRDSGEVFFDAPGTHVRALAYQLTRMPR